jgi:SAM-dependent methyltransferase
VFVVRCARQVIPVVPSSADSSSDARGKNAGGFGSHPMAVRLVGRWPWLAGLIKWVYPPMPTLNVIPAPKLSRIRAALFVREGLVINVGAGTLQGAGARLWEGVEASGAHVLHIDLGPGPGVSLVADAMRLPFAAATVDSVILQAVLEHVPEPEQVIAEAARVLKPGGCIYVEVPFLQGFHADPHDYQRYTIEGLRRRLAVFREIDAGVSSGPFSALVWLLRDLASSWTSSPVLFLPLRFTAAWLLAPLRYLDFVVRSNRVAARLASEVYLLAQKPPGSARCSADQAGTGS